MAGRTKGPEIVPSPIRESYDDYMDAWERDILAEYADKSIVYFTYRPDSYHSQIKSDFLNQF